MSLQKRSVSLDGHRTSIALEPEFWSELQAIARHRSQSLSALIRHVDHNRETGNLASALRLLVLTELKSKIEKRSDEPDGR